VGQRIDQGVDNTMKRRFYLSDIRFIFFIFSKYLNLTRAASELRVHPSTVSRAIDECETLLKVQLVRRVGKHIQLTDVGSVFADKVEKIVNELLNFEENLSKIPIPIKEIRVCAHGSAMRQWVRDAVLDLFEKKTNIRLSLHDQYDIRDRKLVPGMIYVGFGRHWMDDENVVAEQIAPLKIALYCPQGGPVSQNETYDLADALSLGCALPYTDRRLWVRTADGTNHNLTDFVHYCRLESPSFDHLVDSAIRAKISFLAPPECLEGQLQNNIVYEVKLKSEIDPITIDIFYHKYDAGDEDIFGLVRHLVSRGNDFYKSMSCSSAD